MLWLSSLVAKDDASTDSVIVGGLFALLAMTVFVGFDVIVRGHAFDPGGYSLAAVGIIGAIAAGKRLRDGAPHAQ